MDDQPEVDRFSFPLLHTALLSPNQRELNSILRSTPCYCINERDAMGRTALFWAALRGDLEAVNQLLGHGADPSIADNRGSTPLLASVIESSEKVFRSLLDAGANIDARDHLGRTALMEAIRCREHDVDAFRECFEVGLEASFHANPASTGTGLQQRLQGYGRKDPRPIYDRYPLMSANSSGSLAVPKHLLNSGADYTLLDIDNRAVLYMAADYTDLACL